MGSFYIIFAHTKLLKSTWRKLWYRGSYIPSILPRKFSLPMFLYTRFCSICHWYIDARCRCNLTIMFYSQSVNHHWFLNQWSLFWISLVGLLASSFNAFYHQNNLQVFSQVFQRVFWHVVLVIARVNFSRQHGKLLGTGTLHCEKSEA